MSFWQRLADELLRHLWVPDKMILYVRIGITITIIILAAWFSAKIFNLVVRAVLRRKKEPRIKTILPLLQSLFGYFVLVVALILILRVMGVDYKAILAGAGVVGLAVGFGAQTLIRDFISGFFTLFEGLIAAGDYIAVGNIEGTVEKIGLRVTQVRAFDGTLWTIPNGELTRFGNKNRDFMRVLVVFDVAYEQDPERAIQIASQVAEEWYRQNQRICLEKPEVQGILNFGESGMTVRVLCKVTPLQHWQAERELRLRLKKAFDSHGIEIPFPRRVVYQR